MKYTNNHLYNKNINKKPLTSITKSLGKPNPTWKEKLKKICLAQAKHLNKFIN